MANIQNTINSITYMRGGYMILCIVASFPNVNYIISY